MKKYVLFPLVFLLTTVSCKKKETPADDPYGSYNATLLIKKNGQDWEAKSRAVFTDTTLYFSVIEVKHGFVYDIFAIENIQPKTGRYDLVDKRIWDTSKDESVKSLPTAWYNGSFQQGSDVVSRNVLRKNRPHFITIEAYDSVTHNIKGSFSLSFIRDSAWSPLGVYLDTVSYTNASFSATVWHIDELPK